MYKSFLAAIGLAVFSLVASAGLTGANAAVLQGHVAPAQQHEAESPRDDVVTYVGHRDKKVQRSRRAARKTYRRHHRKFHQRYSPRAKNYDRAHRKFHRHYRRKHNRPKLRIDIYPPYYDPYYYNPYYRDPYYYGPTYRHRISCDRARRILRSHGYRRIRAYDCKGRVYGFRAVYNGRRYKLRVSAYSGEILSRRRY
jgi:hypothetical protein